MSLARSEIRRRMAASVTTRLGPSGWRESSYAYETLMTGVGADARTVAHLSFAVGVGQSVPLQDRPNRSATQSETIVNVRSLHRMRADAQVEDYDAALAAVDDCIAAIRATNGNPSLFCRLLSVAAPRAIADGTYLLCETEWSIAHMLPLA